MEAKHTQLWGGDLPERLENDTEYIAFAKHIGYDLVSMNVDTLTELDELYDEFWENPANHKAEGSTNETHSDK